MTTLDWDKSKCLENCQPELARKNRYKVARIKRIAKDDIVADDIAEVYEVLAKIVTTHGEKYLPIFERIYLEIQKNKEKNMLLAMAKSVSEDDFSTDLLN